MNRDWPPGPKGITASKVVRSFVSFSLFILYRYSRSSSSYSPRHCCRLVTRSAVIYGERESFSLPRGGAITIYKTLYEYKLVYLYRSKNYGLRRIFYIHTYAPHSLIFSFLLYRHIRVCLAFVSLRFVHYMMAPGDEKIKRNNRK